jgi:hypothetical protein
VVTLGAVAAGAPREKGRLALEALLKDNYMAEALALLPLVYRHVGMASKALNRIADTLRQWDKALARDAGAGGREYGWRSDTARLCSPRLPK